MKRISAVFIFCTLAFAGFAQNPSQTTGNQKSLLWKISGNGLKKPSYLFGTIHMLCEEDAVLSDSLKKAIRQCDDVYLEVQMDNMLEMLSVITQMKMNGDTTLADLLSKEDYEKVKAYFEKSSSLLPFSVLETFKPILAASTLEGTSLPCGAPVAMEELIMQEAKTDEKEIKGLETMSYQAGILDSIPYKIQAKQLVDYIDSVKSGVDEAKEFDELLNAYKDQNLDKLEQLTKQSDIGMSNYADVLLYNRNRNWVKKLKTLLPEKSLMIAVGAGHLPGEKGVINLLRKEGYTVTPVKSKIARTKVI
ncbi:MAG TPA: TraB/GumN family protein [Chitinophagaceae bacterium]|nr:TraB/GumN family protein [Chitinophagaceae bacterium]